jgi:hypothetical protein
MFALNYVGEDGTEHVPDEFNRRGRQLGELRRPRRAKRIVICHARGQLLNGREKRRPRFTNRLRGKRSIKFR